MKQPVLIYIFLICFSLLTLTEGFAQSAASQNKSRLHIGKKSTPAAATLSKVPNKLDRSISLRPSSAINAYYRSVLLNPAGSNTSNASVKNRTNGETLAVNTPDTRPNIEEIGKSDDLLFSSEKLKVLNAFPNPANDYAEIDYQFVGHTGSAKISLYNVLGANVAEYELDKYDRSLRIQTREMPNGVYFYQLLLDGKKVATKKLLIRH